MELFPPEEHRAFHAVDEAVAGQLAGRTIKAEPTLS
jgi:hypothetical protein